jgi:hypothetical protein
MSELQPELMAYDLLLWRTGVVLVARVQQPDWHRALALALRPNPDSPVAVVAIEDCTEQTCQVDLSPHILVLITGRPEVQEPIHGC